MIYESVNYRQVKKVKPYFEESQKFDQWWLKLIIIGSVLAVVGPMFYGTINQVATGIPWGDNPMSTSGLIIMDFVTTLIMTGVVLLIFKTRLISEIKSDGIHIRFKPFLYKEKLITPGDIEKYEIRTYSSIKDYGGWGVRNGRRGKGIAYNVSGNIGLQLVLKNGRKILIGTQRPEAIKRAMNKLMEN